jgi:hypothetical protein
MASTLSKGALRPELDAKALAGREQLRQYKPQAKVDSKADSNTDSKADSEARRKARSKARSEARSKARWAASISRPPIRGRPIRTTVVSPTSSVLVFQSPPGGALDPTGAFAGSPPAATTLGQQTMVTLEAKTLNSITSDPNTWIEILPPPGSQEAYAVTMVAAIYTAGATPYSTAGGSAVLCYGDTTGNAQSNAWADDFGPLIANTSNSADIRNDHGGFDSTGAIPLGGYLNQALNFGLAQGGGSISGGDGTLELVINYQTFTFLTANPAVVETTSSVLVFTGEVVVDRDGASPSAAGGALDPAGAFAASPPQAISLGKQVVVEISSAQLQNASTIPIPILGAPGTGQMNFITEVAAFFTFGTQTYSSAVFDFIYNGATPRTLYSTDIGGLLQQSTNAAQITTGDGFADPTSTPASICINQPIALVATDLVGTGDGTLVVVVNYQTFPFGS